MTLITNAPLFSEWGFFLRERRSTPFTHAIMSLPRNTTSDGFLAQAIANPAPECNNGVRISVALCFERRRPRRRPVIHSFAKSFQGRIFNPLATLTSVSILAAFSPRSNSPTKLWWRSAFSASSSRLKPALLRYLRMVRPRTLRCSSFAGMWRNGSRNPQN